MFTSFLAPLMWPLPWRSLKRRGTATSTICQLVRIPSISFDGFPAEEVRRSAEATEALLQRRGFENVRLIEFPGGHPLCLWRAPARPGKPTLRFTPTTMSSRSATRASGSPRRSSQSSGAAACLAAARPMTRPASSCTAPPSPASLKSGHARRRSTSRSSSKAREECGSTHLDEFLQTYADLLKADAMVLTDTSNFDVGIPSITTSLRGMVAVEIDVQSLRQPVHSGPGAVRCPTPASHCRRSSRGSSDDQGRMTIPGIYDRVRPVTPLEQQSYDALPYDLDRFRDQAGLPPGVPCSGPEGDRQNPWQTIWRTPRCRSTPPRSPAAKTPATSSIATPGPASASASSPTWTPASRCAR